MSNKLNEKRKKLLKIVPEKRDLINTLSLKDLNDLDKIIEKLKEEKLK